MDLLTSVKQKRLAERGMANTAVAL